MVLCSAKTGLHCCAAGVSIWKPGSKQFTSNFGKICIRLNQKTCKQQHIWLLVGILITFRFWTHRLGENPKNNQWSSVALHLVWFPEAWVGEPDNTIPTYPFLTWLDLTQFSFSGLKVLTEVFQNPEPLFNYAYSIQFHQPILLGCEIPEIQNRKGTEGGFHFTRNINFVSTSELRGFASRAPLRCLPAWLCGAKNLILLVVVPTPSILEWSPCCWFPRIMTGATIWPSFAQLLLLFLNFMSNPSMGFSEDSAGKNYFLEKADNAVRC